MSLKPRVGVTYSDEIKIQPYVDALRAADVEPVLITPSDSASLEGLSGLLLSGGTDLNPALYGQIRHPKADVPNVSRDLLEQTMLTDALDRDLPVLAICRGMQLFNVVHGGTLQQHMDLHEEHQIYTADKATPAHEIAIAAGTRLAEILGTAHASVNSRHHQAVDRVGEGLVVSARAQDGTVEALEDPAKRFAVAVQWHPEDQAALDPIQQRIFDRFAASVTIPRAAHTI